MNRHRKIEMEKGRERETLGDEKDEKSVILNPIESYKIICE